MGPAFMTEHDLAPPTAKAGHRPRAECQMTLNGALSPKPPTNGSGKDADIGRSGAERTVEQRTGRGTHSDQRGTRNDGRAACEAPTMGPSRPRTSATSREKAVEPGVRSKDPNRASPQKRRHPIDEFLDDTE